MKHWILPGILSAVAIAAAGVWSGPAQAAKADDTLNWATDREIAVIDPYYNNTRELVVMGHLGWDGLLFRNLETGDTSLCWPRAGSGSTT
jgi:peptide/nickel transport system substrate-binding protein